MIIWDTITRENEFKYIIPKVAEEDIVCVNILYKDDAGYRIEGSGSLYCMPGKFMSTERLESHILTDGIGQYMHADVSGGFFSFSTKNTITCEEHPHGAMPNGVYHEYSVFYKDKSYRLLVTDMPVGLKPQDPIHVFGLCKIPKGSIYYINEHEQIMSSALRFEREISYEELKDILNNGEE